MCGAFEAIYPEKAIEIVQRWSDQHPQKTYLTELLEKYPNVLLDDNDTPEGICPHQLGLKDSIADCKKGYNCAECWNQPIGDGEKIMIYKGYEIYQSPYNIITIKKNNETVITSFVTKKFTDEELKEHLDWFIDHKKLGVIHNDP